MRKINEFILVLVAVFFAVGFMASTSAAAEGNSSASSWIQFFGSGGIPYEVISITGGVGDDKDFLAVRASFFKTEEEAKEALFSLFEKAFEESEEKEKEGETVQYFHVKYTTCGKGSICLQLNESYMVTERGPVYADVKFFYDMPQFQSQPDLPSPSLPDIEEKEPAEI